MTERQRPPLPPWKVLYGQGKAVSAVDPLQSGGWPWWLLVALGALLTVARAIAGHWEAALAYAFAALLLLTARIRLHSAYARGYALGFRGGWLSHELAAQATEFQQDAPDQDEEPGC